MAGVHPSALVDPGARLGAGVEIGPFVVIGPDVSLGDRVRVDHHASVLGPSSIGADTHVFPFASIGSAPQDLGYKGEPTRLEIGERNVFREFVTINRGTVKGGGLTRIGSDCFFMAYAHVAHDSTIGNHVIMANCAALAGHIRIDDHAILGGLVAVHQWARIGRHGDDRRGQRRRARRAPLLHRLGRAREALRPEPRRPQAPRLLGGAHRRHQERPTGCCSATGSRSRPRWSAVESELPDSAEAAEMLEFIRTTKRGVTR